MRLHAAQLVVLFVALTTFVGAAPPQKHRAIKRVAARAVKKANPPALECGDYVAFQVLLDRQGFSTGEIDGRPGTNFSRALAAMQNARHIAATSQPDCDTWHALGGDRAEAPVTTYTITSDDLKGPFEKTIPRELPKQAELPALGYRSPLEMIAERFHASPALLQNINPRVAIAEGREIKVPAVAPFDANSIPATDPAAGEGS